MTISSYQVQNILRTYAKQLSRGQRMARVRHAAEAALGDQLQFSIEARRKQVIDKITSEIVSNIGSRLPGVSQAWGGVEAQALRQLSKEIGRHLDIVQEEGSGRLMFNEVNPASGEVLAELGYEDSARLQERLFEITQEIVDYNMVSGMKKKGYADKAYSGTD
ncbi:MAG: hypothetical protein KQJ78_00330 [Deltaproteobacteria bacterium]|nr:hypothetical protein [Deltaproteobacteria bacterium]